MRFIFFLSLKCQIELTKFKIYLFCAQKCTLSILNERNFVLESIFVVVVKFRLKGSLNDRSKLY